MTHRQPEAGHENFPPHEKPAFIVPTEAPSIAESSSAEDDSNSARATAGSIGGPFSSGNPHTDDIEAELSDSAEISKPPNDLAQDEIENAIQKTSTDDSKDNIKRPLVDLTDGDLANYQPSKQLNTHNDEKNFQSAKDPNSALEERIPNSDDTSMDLQPNNASGKLAEEKSDSFVDQTETQQPTSNENEDPKELFFAGKLPEAKEAWDRSLRSIEYILGRSYQEDMPTSKIREFEELRKKIWLNLSLVNFKLREFGTCVEYCNKVLERQPFHEKAVWRKASSLMGRVEEAAAEVGSNEGAAILELRRKIDHALAANKKLAKKMMRFDDQQSVGALRSMVSQESKNVDNQRQVTWLYGLGVTAIVGCLAFIWGKYKATKTE